MEGFKEFDSACKKYGLSNHDQALLLQVTPVMISRYRNSDGVSMPPSKWLEKRKVAVNAMKAVVSNSREPVKSMTPARRREVIQKTLVDQNPTIDIPSIY